MNKYQYSDEELKVLENSDVPFAIYQFINNRVVTIVLSAGFFDLFGVNSANKREIYDLMDQNMYRDTHPDDLEFLGNAAYAFAKEDSSYDVVYRALKDGEYRIIHSVGFHIYKEDGIRLAFIMYNDLGPFEGKEYDDSRKILYDRSSTFRLEHDYLTGLPSMTYFFELAEVGCKEIRKNKKTPVLLFMDFNGMKVYNQKNGLQEGDKVLQAFSKEIIALFSHENCSRFGADHFCVYAEEEKALDGAKKLIEANKAKDSEHRMPLRIGYYLYEDESISVSAACDRAQIACDSGRKNYESNIYYFDSVMLTSLEDAQYVTERIDRAISEGWIKVYYQPLVRTANGRVCAEEALSRWDDPDKGFLSPAQFIPVLEESNSIYKLDLYVVDCVLQKMKEQAASGLHVVPMSVNLSRSDFYTCDIVEEIKKRVDGAGVSRDKIVIEITESAIAADINYMIDEIKRFKELGFTVWMDDFGSGYSSPIMLQKVPFDLIKIDMQFVRQLQEGDKAKIVLTETVRMAMSLGLDTIAEGVENKYQADFLKEIGCTMLQGYYFCKAIPLEEIIERNRKGIQIGFEDPKESEYYAKLGKVNMYELSLADTDGHLRNYFDTWPMIMVECRGKKLSVIKTNTSFKKFNQYNFLVTIGNDEFDATQYYDIPGGYSLRAVIDCAKEGGRSIVEDRTPDGHIIQLLIWRVAVNPITGAAAVMVAVLSTMKDHRQISEEYVKLQKEYERLKEEAAANRKISELKKSVAALLTNMPAMTFSKDVSTRKYLACNQAFADYANKKTPEEVVGLTDFEIFDEVTAKHFIEDDKKALSMDKPYIFYEDVPDAAGNPRQFQTTKLKFVDDSGRECLLGLCQDVTDAMRIKKEYVERLAQVRNKALIDALTGVKNKNAYQDAELVLNNKIIDRCAPKFAITILDVNDLKKINDTKGHKAGDESICAACQLICKTFKHSPVFRVGGDEFAVISQKSDFEHIEELIEIIEMHNKKAASDGGIVIACGMAKYDDDENVASVFTRADKKMYENKKNLKEAD